MPATTQPSTDRELPDLIDPNRAWAAARVREEPDFFQKLSHQQTPRYLWIGCSDSRVPANEIVGLAPGEMFVHRNVANVVVHTDLNCLSVMEFAIDSLQVKHIIVVGHSRCGGVTAALSDARIGIADNWLRHVQDVMHSHEAQLSKISDERERLNRLCELNVLEQVLNVSRTTIVQNAWGRGQELAVHGWIYGIGDGLLRDLEICITNQTELSAASEAAVAEIRSTPISRS